MHPELKQRLLNAINSPIDSQYFKSVRPVAQILRSKYQNVHPENHVLEDFELLSKSRQASVLNELQRPCRPSAEVWEIQFDNNKMDIPARSSKWNSPFNPSSTFLWRISACLRGPFLVTLEMRLVDENGLQCWEVSKVQNSELLRLGQEMANHAGIEHVVGSELIDWTVPVKDLRDKIWMRMDYTDEPNAYQLLVEE